MGWETNGWQTTSSEEVNSTLVQESRRAFMSRVYGWMFAGLWITGVMALYTVSNRSLLELTLQWRIPLILVELGLVFVLSMLAPRLSAPIAGLMFVAYSALTGITLSVIFLRYTAGSIGQAFFMAAGSFGALSLYGTFTKKDLSAWASFLFMGLFGVVIASVVNIFMGNGMLSFVTSCAAVVVFAGLTAYDTQKLREMHASHGHSSTATASISGALTLYLDFINLFLALLRIFGSRR